jgi:hypothetical protein
MPEHTWPRIVTAAAVAAATCLSVALPARADPGNRPWASSSGETGAGLGLTSPQGGRFWGEGAFHTQDGLTAFSPLFGLGFFIQPDLELEVMLPLSVASVDVGGGNSDSGFRLGAPYVGVNYIQATDRLRYKIGGGAAWNPVELGSFPAFVALLAGEAMRGRWDYWLWTAQRLNLAAPFRIEYDASDSVVLGGDAGFDIGIPTGDGDNEEVYIIAQLAPGVGFHLSPEWVLGMRLSGVFFLSGDQDDQFAFEPYLRGAFGSGFFLARGTFNLDEPYGHAFQDEEIWAIHAGGGFAW